MIVNPQDKNKPSKLDWKFIGDIALGRPNMGTLTSVAMYRLMQYSLRYVIESKFGVEKTAELLFEAGQVAGFAAYENLLQESQELNLNEFLAKVEKLLIDLKVGILRMESADLEKMEFTLVVEEDIDCSGLPIIDDEVCTFDEGFISALFSAYTGKDFTAKEVDCWCTGDRVCRFEVNLVSNG